MKRTPIYKIVDHRGRVYLPIQCREAAGIGCGDIVRLDVQHGQIAVRRVELIEIGDQSTSALAAYITAGVPYLDSSQLKEVISQLLKCLQNQEVGGNEQ